MTAYNVELNEDFPDSDSYISGKRVSALLLLPYPSYPALNIEDQHSQHTRFYTTIITTQTSTTDVCINETQSHSHHQ